MRSVTRAALRRRGPSEEVPYIPPEFAGITKRLVEAREAAGLAVSDVDNATRLERGYRLKGLQALTALRLARLYGVSVHWLLTGEGPMRVVDAPSHGPRVTRHRFAQRKSASNCSPSGSRSSAGAAFATRSTQLSDPKTSATSLPLSSALRE